MASAGVGPDAYGIERGLRRSAPELLFAPPRTVRRLLRRHRDEPFAWRPPVHREIAVLDAARLAEIAGDLIVPPADMPPRVAVVARPDLPRLGRRGPAAILRDYWRRSFHALVDLAGAAAVRSGGLDLRGLLGAEAAEEAREVLERESLLDRDAADGRLAVEFAATFLELRCFAPSRVADWFPAVADPDDVAVRLSAELDAEDLLARALPAGLDPAEAGEEEAGPPPRPSRVLPAWMRPRGRVLRRRADRAAAAGNVVRAMLDEWRAGESTHGSTGRSSGRLERHVAVFADRLAAALGLGAADRDDAAWLVRTLADRAAGSSWSAEARLLYDLQKLCVDSERPSFRTQLLRWAVSAGRMPLTTPLPCQQTVLVHRHAVAAAARLETLGLRDMELRRGGPLLAAAAETTAAAVRGAVRPPLCDALHAAGLRPGSLVEDAAAAKLVAELLDTTVGRGFISFGGVRDAISRNQLKLGDLRDPQEWLEGDALVRLDRLLAPRLDGVYRPAPLSLSLLQRLSASFFGVPAGRLLTSHVLLPFGGAWILLRGLEHVVEPVTEYSLGTAWHVYGRGRMVATGVTIWALLHLPPVRRTAWQACRGAAATLHFLAFVLPVRLLRMPAIERLLRSPPLRWFVRHAWSPTVVTCATWLALPHHGHWLSRSTPGLMPGVFLASGAVLNTRTGRRLQELAVEAAVRLLHRLHAHVVVALVAWVVDVFRRAMDAVEAGLYAVDESLRFRSGEPRLVLAAKAVAGAAWSIVEAVARFCITLLIEPQLNPIKHFPVVTVSHKLLVPMIPVVAAQLVAATGMDRGLALTSVTFVSTAVPGVFGFLAWELKENWRLYEANRPRTLRPVPVGDHGETVRRLLLPGFHSGTVPKLFAGLRRGRRAAARLRDDLEHAVAAFVRRDVIALLERAAASRNLGVLVEGVHLEVRRIRILLGSASLPDSDPLVLDLARRDRAIESRIVEQGWLSRLEGPARREVLLALAGYHRFAAADTASAESAEMPTGTAAPPRDRGLVPLTAIAWDAWRDAWERERDAADADAADDRPGRGLALPETGSAV